MPPPTSAPSVSVSVQDSHMYSPANMAHSKAQVHAQQQALAQAQAAAQVVANAMRGGDKQPFQPQTQQQQQQQQQQHQTQTHQTQSHQQQQLQQQPQTQGHVHSMNGVGLNGLNVGGMNGSHPSSMQMSPPPPPHNAHNVAATPTNNNNNNNNSAGSAAATPASATPTQNDISHAAEKVLQRAEISRMTRNLKSRLKLATYKTKRGWDNLTFDTIEQRVDEEIKPLSPSSAGSAAGSTQGNPNSSSTSNTSTTAGSATSSSNANATRSMYMTTTDQMSSPPLQQPFHPLSTPRFPPGNYPGSVHRPGGPQSPATLYDLGSPKAKLDHYPMLSPAKIPETRKRARTITSAPGGSAASPRLHYSKSYQQLPFAMSQQQQQQQQMQQQHMHQQQQQQHMFQQQFAPHAQPMAKSQSMGALSQMKLSRDEIMDIDSELDARDRREREQEQRQQQQQRQQHDRDQQQQQQQQQHQQHQQQHSTDATHTHSLGAALANRSLEPPRTPPQKPRKLGAPHSRDENRDEGADLLMYLATSPSPAQRPSSSSQGWGATGGTPVQSGSAAAPQTPSQNFNFNDYLHMMTPSPAQVSHSPYHAERTPSTPNRLRLGQIPRSARRRLNFDKIPASPTSSERDSR